MLWVIHVCPPGVLLPTTCRPGRSIGRQVCLCVRTKNFWTKLVVNVSMHADNNFWAKWSLTYILSYWFTWRLFRLDSKVNLYIGWQWRNFFIPYLCQLFFRHVVGQAMRSVSYSDITFLVRYSDNTDIFLNQLIQFYSNNATNLRHLTTYSTTVLTYKMAIVLQPQICDVISSYM